MNTSWIVKIVVISLCAMMVGHNQQQCNGGVIVTSILQGIQCTKVFFESPQHTIFTNQTNLYFVPTVGFDFAPPAFALAGH